MRKTIETLIVSVICVTALVSAPTLAVQQPSPTAPVPSQIFSAKKVFISNAKGPIFGWGKLSRMPDRPYNQFYATMKIWGRYELVTAPADADIVFEIHFDVLGDPSYGWDGNTGTTGEPQLDLAIYDAKTHFSLWWFTERFIVKNRHSTRDIQFDDAMTALTDDVKKLATTTVAAATGK